MCDYRHVILRHRLPWTVSILLMATGSAAAHGLGGVLVSSPATTVDTEGGTELAGRVSHGYVTVLPLVAGVLAALLVLIAGLGVLRRMRGVHVRGASPVSFLLLPPLAYALQEIAERLLHAESFPFNPAHEPTFLLALILQLPLGVLAFLLGRALLGLGRRLAAVLFGRKGPREAPRSTSGRHVHQAILLRGPVLALGYSERGPPAVASVLVT